jgi:type I restriction enzyme S subunit
MNDAYGGAQPHISQAYVKELKIPLPPLDQQKKIASILDVADAYRQKTKALISKYDELTQSLFLDMFGDPVKNPKGLIEKPLGDILSFLTSGSRGWAKYYSTEGDVFLRIQNIGYNQLKTKELTYVNAPASTESKRTRVQTGDIVISITADLGRTAVIPEDFPVAYINQHLAILRLNSENNPYYLSAYIASKAGQSLFRSLDKGGVKAGLNFSDLKSYKVLCPPTIFQNQFAERIAIIEQ